MAIVVGAVARPTDDDRTLRQLLEMEGDDINGTPASLLSLIEGILYWRIIILGLLELGF